MKCIVPCLVKHGIGALGYSNEFRDGRLKVNLNCNLQYYLMFASTHIGQILMSFFNQALLAKVELTNLVAQLLLNPFAMVVVI